MGMKHLRHQTLFPQCFLAEILLFSNHAFIDCDLPRCVAIWSCEWLPTFGWNVSPPSSELKIQTINYSEALVTTYQIIRHHNPEEHNGHLQPRYNFKLSFMLICKDYTPVYCEI